MKTKQTKSGKTILIIEETKFNYSKKGRGEVSLEFGCNGNYFLMTNFGNNYGNKETVAVDIQINGIKNTYCLIRFEALQIVQHLNREFGFSEEELKHENR